MTAMLRHSFRDTVARDHPTDLPPLEEVEEVLKQMPPDDEFEAWLHSTARPAPVPDHDLDRWIASANRSRHLRRTRTAS